MSVTGLKRDTIDKYYTKAETVSECIDRVDAVYGLSSFDLIVEPSAGNGAFLQGMDGLPVVAYDIAPEHPLIIRQDFLRLQTTTIDAYSSSRVLVIGNPPFGRQSSTARRFIKQAQRFASVIAFILPRSFKKPSMCATFDPHFHLAHESDLSDNAFLVQGKDYDVPCIFQIWEWRPEPRISVNRTQPYGFSFVTKERAQASIRRVGVYAGTMSLEPQDKCEHTHYFIAFDEGCDRAAVISGFNGIAWAHNNTVGPRSVSKQEVVRALNPIMQALLGTP
jgi:predicted RNA methylase